MKPLNTLLKLTYNERSNPLIFQVHDKHALISIQFPFLHCLDEMKIQIAILYLYIQHAIFNSTTMLIIGSGFKELINAVKQVFFFFPPAFEFFGVLFLYLDFFQLIINHYIKHQLISILEYQFFFLINMLEIATLHNYKNMSWIIISIF